MIRVRNLLILLLFISMNSCSTRLVGVYSAKGTVADQNRKIGFYKELQLNKDSSFSYTESYKPPDALMPDNVLEGVPPIKFVGRGMYSIERKNLILNFSSKIRKIDTIIVSRLTDREAESYWYEVDYSRKIPGDKNNIFIRPLIGDYYFNISSNMGFSGFLKINDNIVQPRRINYLAYDNKDFPVRVTLGFDRLTGKDQTYRFLKLFSLIDEKTLDFNLGYLDEVINIPEPGNYLIEIRAGDSQAFIGKRSFPIQSLNGTQQIGDLTKVKSINSKPFLPLGN